MKYLMKVILKHNHERHAQKIEARAQAVAEHAKRAAAPFAIAGFLDEKIGQIAAE